MKTPLTPARLFYRISLTEAAFGSLWMAYALIKGQTTHESYHLMFSISLFVAAGFTFIIGAFSHSIGKTGHDKNTNEDKNEESN